MARIETYKKDTQITVNDKLIGSNYGGFDNQGRPVFTTANFVIGDLLTFFQENANFEGASIQTISQDLNKIKTYYSYDESGNITGLSTAGVSLIVNSSVSDSYATASFQTNVESSVLTFNEDGSIATLSQAFANLVMQTENTTDYAEASVVTALSATVQTLDTDVNARIDTNATAIATESEARATLGTTLQANIDTLNTDLSASIATNAAAIVTESEARAELGTTLQASIETVETDLSASIATNSAAIVTESEARATADTTLQANIDTLDTDLSASIATNTAAIVTESEARATLGTTLQANIDTLETDLSASIATNSAAIVTESEARATADTTLQANIDTLNTDLSASIATNSAAIVTESEARATADTTLQANIDTLNTDLSASIATNAAAIVTESEARATLGTTLQANIDTLETDLTASIATNAAAIVTESEARATADTTLQANIDTLETETTALITTNAEAIATETTARVTADTTLQANIDTLDTDVNARIDTNQTAIADETTARVSADTTLQANIDTVNTDLSALISTNAAAIVTESEARATLETNLTASIELKPDVFRQDDEPLTTYALGSIWFDTNDNNKPYVLQDVSGTNTWVVTDDSRIAINISSIATANENISTNTSNISSNASKITELETQFTFTGTDITGVAGAINTAVSTAQADAESASATKIETLASNFFTGYSSADGTFTAVSVSEAFANEVFTTTTNTDFASSTALQTLSATVGDNTASITTAQGAIADLEGHSEAYYNLSVDVNGNIAGMRLLADTEDTEIVFTADTFKIYNGTTSDALFILDGSQLKLNVPLNGVSGSFSGDISAATGTFTGGLNINDKFLVSSAGAVQVYAGAGATLGSGARFEILDDSGNSKYRLYGGGINFNAWAGGSNAFNSVDALGGGSLFFSDVAHVYAGNGTTTTTNHGFTINVNGGSKKMFIKATELRIDPAASDPTNHTTIINGDLEVVGNVSFATTTTGDVTVSNLETRLGQIDSDIQIGADNTVDVTFPGNVQVNGILKGPATFTIDPSAYGDATGTVQILGNLRVDGTTTTINSTTVTIADKNIVLAEGSSTAGDAVGAGITIDGANASFTYNADDLFEFSKWITAGKFIGDVQGNVVGNLTGNSATATKLAAAIDIALDGAVTGTASFDGSANITITTTVNHNHDDRYYTETESDNRFVNVTGDTLTGDLNFNSEVKSRYYAAGLGDVNDRYEILGLGNTLMLRYWDNDQGNGTSINSPLMHLEWGGASGNSMVLYGDLILRNEMSVDPEVDVKILDMDVAGGVVNLTNVNNGTFLGTLSAASITANNTLTVGSTNVYNALPTGVAFTATDNRFKLQVTTNGGATAETTIAPLLLSDVLTEGYVPFVGTGDGGSATVNSKLSNSWLKLTADTLELGASDPVSHQIRYARFLWQSGSNDKVSTVYGAKDIAATINYLGGSATAKIGFTTGTGAGRIRFNDEYAFPAADGTSGQVLTTNGSGDLSWTSVNLTEADPIYTSERDSLLLNKMVHATLLFSTLADYNKPSGYSTMIQPSSYQNPLPSHGYYHIIARRDTQGGYGALLQSYDSHDIYHGNTTQSTVDITWYKLWTSGDFSSTNVSNWNTAYGWGNHAGLYLSIGGKAADSELLDGVDSSRVVFGTNETKSIGFDNGNINNAIASGFYDGQNITGAPTSDYHHIIHSRHSNPGNNYAMQIAGNFFSESLNYRQITNNVATPWRAIIHSGNIGSQSVKFSTTAGDNRFGNILVGEGTYKNTIVPIDDTNLNINTPSGAVYFGNYTIATGSHRAPIFYDSNDTGYYIDPTNNSRLAKLRVESAGNQNGGNIKIGGGGESTAKWSVLTGSHYNDVSESKGIMLIGSYAANGSNRVVIGGDIYEANPATQIDFHTHTAATHATGGTKVAGINNSQFYHISSVRSPIFYDSNDTGHYIDPASTGLSANFNGNIEVYARSAAWAEGLRVRVPATNTWGGIRWTRDRPNYDGNWALGFKGAGDTTDDLVFWANNAGSEGDKARMDKAGNFTAITSSRSPIFYDSNNTNYYVDPTSTSNISNLHLDGYIHVSRSNTTGNGIILADDGDIVDLNDAYCSMRFSSGVRVFSANRGGSAVHTLHSDGNAYFNTSARSPIFYDNNDTNYYVDPNSTSVLNAANFNKIGGFLDVAFTDFYVYGDENTYYPVIIAGGAGYGFHEYSITRGYGWTAPWNPIGTGVHHGGLTFNFYWSGDTAWGGNDHTIRVKQFTEQYTTMVAGLALPVTGGVCVWLRGGGSGGALYRLRAPRGHDHGYTVYDGVSASGHSTSTTFTAANGATFSARTDTSNNSAEIYGRYPVRNTNEIAAGSLTASSVDAGTVYGDDVYTTGGWFRNHTNNNGIYWSSTGWHLNPYNSNDFTMRSGSSTESTIRFANSSDTTWGYIHNDANKTIGFLNNSRGWVSYTDTSGNHFSVSSSRAPVFYDSNDTNFYINPNGTSNVNDFQVQGDLKMFGTDSFIWTPNSSTGFTGFWDTHNSLVAARYRNNTKSWELGDSVWINADNNSQFNNYNENIRLRNAGNGVSVIAFGAEGDGGQPTSSILGFNDRHEIRFGANWQTRIYSSYAEASGSYRAPIFYDSNDTGYYVNPNGITNLGGANDFPLRVLKSSGYNSGCVFFQNNSGDNSWGIVGEYRVGGGPGTDRPSILFSHGFNNNTWSVGFGTASDDNFRIKIDHGHRNGGWGTDRMVLDRSGNVTFSGDVTAFSDASVKENIRPIESALDKIKQIEGVTYNRTDLEDKSDKIGFIAQEILKVLPEVVTENEDGKLSVSYGNITAVLVEAIKEQQKQIEELKTQIETLKH